MALTALHRRWETGPHGAKGAPREPVGTGSSWRNPRASTGLDEVGKREAWKRWKKTGQDGDSEHRGPKDRV